MDTGQLAIKIILIIVLVAFGAFLLFPGSGARHLALRRLSMLFLMLVVIVAVVFPSIVTGVANLVGVGRGTDLLLYGLIVVFIGNSLVVQRRQRKTEIEVTRLARLVAIQGAPDAGTVFAGETPQAPAAPAPADGSAAPDSPHPAE